jgi:hypothetical protein
MLRPRGLSNGFSAVEVMFPQLDLEHQVSFGGSGGQGGADVDLHLNGRPNSSMQFISNNNMVNLTMYGTSYDRVPYSPNIYKNHNSSTFLHPHSHLNTLKYAGEMSNPGNSAMASPMKKRNEKASVKEGKRVI